MGRIDDIFLNLRNEGRKALMPFVCGGSPRDCPLDVLIPALERGGASIVEVGIPFSDPVADGPVIAKAMHEALERGTTPQTIFDQVSRVRSQTALGIVAMVSVSIVHRLGGADGFASAAVQAGFDGLIIPDLPVEESKPYTDAAHEAGLALSLLVSPSTLPERAEQIARASTGFVYLLTRAGITGTQGDAPDVAQAVARLRSTTDLPIACGFGISTADHVRAVVEHADAAIVGSVLVSCLSDSPSPEAEAERFVRDLAVGLAANQPSRPVSD